MSAVAAIATARAHDAFQRYAVMFDTAKTVLFVYVLLTNGLKARRHIRARGFRQTIAELWTWLCQVSVSECGTILSAEN